MKTQTAETAGASSAGGITLAGQVSALEPQPVAGTSITLEYGKRLMLFSGRANPALAAKIAGRLNVDLGGVTLKTFSNGEVYCRYEESIRGADVFLVQPTCANPAEDINANDALMELMVMIDAAVGASAHRVIAVTPWYGYSRQDKKSTPREPITARLVAQMLEAAGADRVLTMDLHAGQVQGFFHKPVDHMTAMFILTQYFRDLHLDDIVVVSPDAGRVKLAKKFAEKVGAELAILNKERPAQQVAEIAYVIGDVKDKTAVIVDDLIDTAGTLRAAAETVKDEGARCVYACATHGVFSGNAWENLAAAPFEEVVVTDTIPMRPGAPGERPRALLRRPADRLDPPHLHRRLGVRGVRRREPAVLSAPAAQHLQELLGLSEEELLRVLDADPLAVITGELEHRPELPILLDLLAEAEERAGAPVLRRWVRAAGPAGRPLDMLLARDFGAFEDALGVLEERGFVLRSDKVSPARRELVPRPRLRRRYSSGSGRFSPGHEPVR